VAKLDSEALDGGFDKFLLISEKPFLLKNLVFDQREKLVRRNLPIFADSLDNSVEFLQVRRRMLVDVVFSQDVVNELQFFGGLVASANDISVDEGVWLQMSIHVMVLDEVKSAKCIKTLPSLLTADGDLEKTHSLRSQLTHF